MEKLRDPVRSLSKNIVDDDSDAEESDTEIKDQDANIVAEANGSSLVLSESCFPDPPNISNILPYQLP